MEIWKYDVDDSTEIIQSIYNEDAVSGFSRKRRILTPLLKLPTRILKRKKENTMIVHCSRNSREPFYTV